MPPQPSSSRRSWEIDAIRGLMLVLMTITHLPTRLTWPLGQPFGFVSAAEGFVLLSAYMAGLIYGRQAWTRGLPQMRQAFLRRAGKIYACQAATLLFLFTVIAFIGFKVDQPAVKELMRFYLTEPAQALIGGLLLVYEPPLLDILPLYILFMLVSPWVMTYALKNSWVPVMAVSIGLWLAAQFGFSEWMYTHVSDQLPLSIPFAETGAFNMWAWQFLWILGLWMGASRNEPGVAPFTFSRGTVWAAGAIALTCFVWRHITGQNPFPNDPELALMFDKWLLSPMRMTNLFALVVLTIHFGPALAARIPRPRWLETLGAASLAVFCAHLVVVLLVLGFYGPDKRPWPQDVVLLVVCYGTLYAVARITLWLDRRPPGGTPKTGDKQRGAGSGTQATGAIPAPRLRPQPVNAPR